MATKPLVSCIMPTRNRRRFVAQAVAYFQRQDHQPRELLVLDDGDDPVEDLVPRDSRIRYIRLQGHWPLGRKRNLACELSHGEVICHWDDDDWMATHRVSFQLAHLLERDADVCGVREVLHYRPKAGEAWLYRSLPGDRTWLHGGTLMYRRSAWEAKPFPDVHVGEDAAFIWQISPERVHGIADRRFYVALLHDRNTAAKNLRDGRWERLRLDEVSRLLSPDREFYAALRNGAAAAPARDGPSRCDVTVVAPFQVYDGYGSMAEYLVLGMQRAGADVGVSALTVDRRGLAAETLDLLDRSKERARGGPVLFFSWPSPPLRRFSSEPELFVNTMWESSRLPAGWADALNNARAVIVPTRFVAGVCRDSGVTAPIEVIPEGVDPDVYHYEERPERETLTALMVGPIVERKHVREGIVAWKQAFGDDPAARLIIKARFSYRNYRPNDPRIRFVDADERTRGIAHWYREADVLMALGNEGFGLPLVEGMATGLPVIALDAEGQSDTCADARDLLLPVPAVDWRPCDDPPFGPAGMRAVPTFDDIANRLRWVAEHRDEARELGRAASNWAVRHRDVWDKGPAVLAAMEQRLAAPRPLRRPRTLWTPTWGTPCGLAEYLRDLAGGGAIARLTATLPDLRGVRLLHVQHEPSLFDDAGLVAVARRARAARVPMVVTEHAVGVAAPWERDVAALVAPSAAAAEALRARCEGTRVEHIPLGCHTWFPPRKARRGRVIGAFGFLEHHKGFGQLLEVARELGDVELVLYSHPKRDAAGREWDEAIGAAGVPVRWDRAYRAVDEIARRLAAETDLLVFWYDEAPILSASGAVRVGLATGVPVLASPTSWFSDLRNTVFQPEDLAAGVVRLLEDTPLREELGEAAREYCEEYRWQEIARRHEELWRSVEAERGYQN